MKKSIILSAAFSILTLTLVSCETGPGTDTTTTRQATNPAMAPPRPVTAGAPMGQFGGGSGVR
jgi:hypothetical protein